MRLLGALAVLLLGFAFPAGATADHCGGLGEVRPAVGPPGTVFVFHANLGTSADLFVYRDGTLVQTLPLTGDDELSALITTGPNDDGTWRVEAIASGTTDCRAEASFGVIPGTTAEIWVGLTGPQDWRPKFAYSLEIGGHAWTMRQDNPGGLVAEPVGAATVVRVRRLPDCTPVVRFVAPPGRQYNIRFDEHDAPRVEDWTLLGMDTPGPPGERGTRICPRLPDTASAVGTPPMSAFGLLVGGATLAALVLARRHATAASGVHP